MSCNEVINISLSQDKYNKTGFYIILVVPPVLPGICFSGSKISIREIYHIYDEYKIGGDLYEWIVFPGPIQMEGSGPVGLQHGL